MKCPNNYNISMFPQDKCMTCDYYSDDGFGTTCCTVNIPTEEQEETKKGGNKND